MREVKENFRITQLLSNTSEITETKNINNIILSSNHPELTIFILGIYLETIKRDYLDIIKNKIHENYEKKLIDRFVSTFDEHEGLIRNNKTILKTLKKLN